MKPVPGAKKVGDFCFRARAPTFPFFDQRIKLSFASESSLSHFIGSNNPGQEDSY